LLEPLVLKDHRVRPELSEHRVSKVFKGLKDILVLSDLRGPQVFKGLRAKQVQKEIKAIPD
jgi:hypothetical protein